MTVALFVPCFIDAFFPDVGVATLELLERFDCDVDYSLEQTCCAQPMDNGGCEKDAAATGTGSDALYGDSLVYANLAHVLSRYAREARGSSCSGLSLPRLRRVIDYVDPTWGNRSP